MTVPVWGGGEEENVDESEGEVVGERVGELMRGSCYVITCGLIRSS